MRRPETAGGGVNIVHQENTCAECTDQLVVVFTTAPALFGNGCAVDSAGQLRIGKQAGNARTEEQAPVVLRIIEQGHAQPTVDEPQLAALRVIDGCCKAAVDLQCKRSLREGSS